MPQRQTKFSETWLSSVDSNGQRIGEWCRKGQNEYQAYCQFCDVQVKCDNAGKTQLLQHSKQKKHIDAIKHSVDKKQKSSIYHRHIEHFFAFFAGNNVFSLVSESPC